MADLELNSIGNGDGNNYLLRDNTKIPLSGSNAISGSLIPATTNAYDLGGPSYQWNNAYIKSLTINGVACGDILTHNESEFVNVSSNQTIYGIKTFRNVSVVEYLLLNSTVIARTVDDSSLVLRGGVNDAESASFTLFGKDASGNNGKIRLIARNTSAQMKDMTLYPNGTWTWNGTAVQLTSDQRLKQQITEIDDKLLDAWEDVNLVQFKYNDAVDQKKDKARLHTGYVVQQIDEACKSHNVDISKYGLYCHEEYPEETEEVEVEQADGTKVKETKVIREASEHYSLRYTEALIVECAYLRKKNKDLQEQLNSLSERLEKLENR